jgi:hypothetical protein
MALCLGKEKGRREEGSPLTTSASRFPSTCSSKPLPERKPNSHPEHWCPGVTLSMEIDTEEKMLPPSPVSQASLPNVPFNPAQGLQALWCLQSTSASPCPFQPRRSASLTVRSTHSVHTALQTNTSWGLIVLIENKRRVLPSPFSKDFFCLPISVVGEKPKLHEFPHVTNLPPVLKLWEIWFLSGWSQLADTSQLPGVVRMSTVWQMLHQVLLVFILTTYEISSHLCSLCACHAGLLLIRY